MLKGYPSLIIALRNHIVFFKVFNILPYSPQ